MKKILGISIVLSNLLLASPYSDAEIILKDSLETNFKCSTSGCISNGINKVKDNGTLKTGEIKINFLDGLSFSYDKEEALKKAKEKCQGDMTCQNEEMTSYKADTFSKLLSQSKEISVSNINVTNKDSGVSSKVEKLSFISEKRMPEFTPEKIKSLTMADLITHKQIILKGVESSDSKDFLKVITSLLPRATTRDFRTGEVTVNKDIKDINSKLIKMYEEIAKKVSGSNKGDLNIDISSKANGSNLEIDIALTSTFDNGPYDSVKGNISLLFKDAINNIKSMYSMKDNGMFILSALSSNLIVKKVSLDINQDKLFKINQDLKASNKDYKLNNDKVIELLKGDKFSFFNQFKYKLLSLSNKEGVLTIENTTNLPLMQAFAGMDNKDLIKKEIEFK